MALRSPKISDLQIMIYTTQERWDVSRPIKKISEDKRTWNLKLWSEEEEKKKKAILNAFSYLC